MSEKNNLEGQLQKTVISAAETPSQGSDEDGTARENTPVILKDGGLRAWLQVLGGFLLWFNLWGYIFAFGTFQNFYQNDFLRGTSPSSIAWIGSIQPFLLIISGLYTGPLFDLGYFRSMIFAGALLSTFGSFMLSLSTKYWHILLTQGFCIGLGCGILFVPSMALVARSFEKRRAVAVGVMSCGAPVGAIIYTFIFEGLITKTSFGWAARAMAFFMVGTYLLSFPLLMWRVDNTGMIGDGKTRRLLDKKALADGGFWSYAACVTTQFMIYLIPFFFMPTYAQTELGSTLTEASAVLAIAQAASVPGRVIAAVAANYIGVMIPWTICALVSGMMCFVWIAVKTLPGFIAFAAIYGAFSGALVPLPPSVFPKLVDDPAVLGTRLGMAQAVSSIGNIVGPPIGGALLQAGGGSGHNWLALQLFSGFGLMFAALEILGMWWLLVNKRNTKILV